MHKSTAPEGHIVYEFFFWGEGGAWGFCCWKEKNSLLCVLNLNCLVFCFFVICVCLFFSLGPLDYRETFVSVDLIFYYIHNWCGDVCQSCHGWSNRSQLQKPLLFCSSSSSILYCHINELTLLKTLNNNNNNQPSLYKLHALETIYIRLEDRPAGWTDSLI
jgi:hypothetical protein